MNREEVLSAARSCIDIPWHHSGRNEHGMDCAGPIARVLDRLGVAFTDERRYSLGRDNLALYERMLEPVCDRWTGDPAEADFLLFKWSDAPSHAAVMTCANTIIHIQFEGRVYEEPFTALWASRVTSAWKVRSAVGRSAHLSQ